MSSNSIEQQIEELNKVKAEFEASIRYNMALAGFRPRSPEEIAKAQAEDDEREKKHQEYLAELYQTGEYEIYKRSCPVCGKVFYTTNPRRVYDDYYACSRYAHRANAKAAREAARLSRCEVCGNAFTPKRAGAKYCSGACKQRAYRERVTVNASTQNEHTEQE